MAFLGMRGNGDWVANQQPEDFRQSILYLNPNGAAPLTGITSMMGSEECSDPTIHWWTKNLPTETVALNTSGVYKQNTLTSKYVEGTDPQPAAGDVFYLNLATSDDASIFRKGMTVQMEKLGDYRYHTKGVVRDVSQNGSSSYIAVELNEASDGTYDIDEVNRVTVIGTQNPEGGTRPDAVAYDPVEYYNYTQIFRTPVLITNTARNTQLRTGDALAEAKREALQLHGIQIEKALIFGVRSSRTGQNGKPERTMDGILPALQRESATNGNVEAFGHVSPFNTNDWLTVTDGLPLGEQWLDKKLEILFRYGEMEKLALCGSGALLGIQELAKISGQINITPMTVSYGIKVMEWITPYGTLYFKTHPLLTQNPAYRYSTVIVEPHRLKIRPLRNRDTKYIEDADGMNNGLDAYSGEWITEMTLEYHHPPAHGFLDRIGLAHDEAITA